MGIGELLAEVDLELVRLRGYSTVTPLLITNPERLSEMSAAAGNLSAGSDRIIQYRITN